MLQQTFWENNIKQYSCAEQRKGALVVPINGYNATLVGNPLVTKCH